MSILFPAERRATAQQRVARRKAVEKSLAAYVSLDCGHVTTREAIDIYKDGAPKGFPYYCEACHEYRKRQPKSKGNQLPDEPPY